MEKLHFNFAALVLALSLFMGTRTELIGDIIALLQSPIKNVISALQGNDKDEKKKNIINFDDNASKNFDSIFHVCNGNAY